MAFVRHGLLPSAIGITKGGEDAFKINFSPLLFLWLAAVISFSNKLHELGKFMVQVEAVILEVR